MQRIFEGRTVVCIGTGPSLTLEQIDAARRKGFALAGCNNVWQIVPDLVLLYACNEAWWQHYWSAELAAYPAQKWTTNRVAAEKWGINWIAERDRPGLSTDPAYIHHGNGSGYSLLNLVTLMGAERVVLLGYDLRYAADYDGRDKRVGSTPRHYFGEYPSDLLHWPKLSVQDGVHVRLVELYRTVRANVLNATPGSAIDAFPRVVIDEL